MTKIDDYDLGFLNDFLGREISPEKESCKNYLDVYNKHIDDLRIIIEKDVTMSAIEYIKFLLGKNVDLGNAMTFVYHVVKKEMDFNQWLEKVYKGVS